MPAPSAIWGDYHDGRLAEFCAALGHCSTEVLGRGSVSLSQEGGQ